MFGQRPLDYDAAVLVPGGGPAGEGEVRARTLTPDEALLDYLRDHGLSRISKRLVSSGALDVVATAAPGIKDILILGKVKQLERAGDADLLVLDAPAAGHAITFLRSASALLDTVRVGPDQRPGPRRARDAHRPRALPGDARDAARGDPGERAGRHRLQPRGPGGRGPRAGGGERPLRRGAGLDADPDGGGRGGRHHAPARARPRRWPAAAAVPARPDGAAGRAGRPPGRPAARSPRSGCRSCSPPRSVPTELDQLADRLLAEVEALPEVV